MHESDPTNWPRRAARPRTAAPAGVSNTTHAAARSAFGRGVFMALPTATALVAPSGILTDVNVEWCRLTGTDDDTGTPIWRRFAPAERSHITGLIARLRDTADTRDARPHVTGTQLRLGDGRYIDVALRLSATRHDGVVVLIAQMERLSGGGGEPVRRPGTGDRHLTLATIARSAATGTDLRRISHGVVTAIAHVTGCPLVGLWRRASRQERFVLVDGLGFGPTAQGRLVLDGHDGGLADHTIRSRSVVVIGGPTGTVAQLPSVLVEHGVSSGVAVPLQGIAGGDGLLTVSAPHNQPMDPEDIRFLGIVGDLLTMTLQRESVDHLVAAERQRTVAVARDLAHTQRRHDLAGSLVGLHDWSWIGPEPVSAQRRVDPPPRWSAQICLDAGPQALVDCAFDTQAGEVADALNAALAEADDLRMRVRLRTTDGPVAVSLYGLIDRDEDGAVVRSWGVATVTPDVQIATSGHERGDHAGATADHDAGDPSDQQRRHVGRTGHDLNNLLAAVLGTAQQLIEQGGDRHRLTAIVRASRRARELVAGLHPEYEEHPLADAYDVSDVIDHLRPLLRGLLGRDVHLVLQVADDVHIANPPRERLEHVLLDLVANSRDAISDGGAVMIAVDAHVQLDDAPGSPPAGRWARIRVCDNGSGMTADDRTRVFAAGFTTKSGRDHAGLGLATVRSTIERAGGVVTIDSVPQRGTVVELYVPLTRRTHARLQPLRALALPRTTPTHQTHGPATPARVAHRDAVAPVGPGAADRHATPVALVVDDEPALRELLAGLLGRLGYDTIAAADGERGLAQARRLERLDLLVSDVVMPNVDGLELLRGVRGRFDQVAAVLLSGAALPGPITDPGVRVLRKPFEWTDLRDAVHGAISQVAARAGSHPVG